MKEAYVVVTHYIDTDGLSYADVNGHLYPTEKAAQEALNLALTEELDCLNAFSNSISYFRNGNKILSKAEGLVVSEYHTRLIKWDFDSCKEEK